MSEHEVSDDDRAISEIDERLRSSVEAPGCHKCGCFQGTVESLEETELADELTQTLAAPILRKTIFVGIQI